MGLSLHGIRPFKNNNNVVGLAWAKPFGFCFFLKKIMHG